jgi:hypothetical protein
MNAPRYLKKGRVNLPLKTDINLGPIISIKGFENIWNNNKKTKARYL